MALRRLLPIALAVLAGCQQAVGPPPPDIPAPSCVPGDAACAVFTDQAALRGILHVTDALADQPRTDTLGGAGPYGAGNLDQLDRMGSGVAVGDLDQDGRMDLFFPDRGPDHLYRARADGTFEDISEWLGGGDGDGRAGLWFDYDDDGYPDLFVCNLRDPSRLLHNEAGRSLRDVSQAAGVLRSSACQGAAAADVDEDGRLDLLVVNYYRFWEPGAPSPLLDAWNETEFLYRNNGDGTFTDSAAAAGLSGDGPSLAASFADYDEDGHMDLLVVNDFYHPSSLWRGAGGGRFERANDAAGLHSAREGMGAVWADFDGNGHLDAYVSNVFVSLTGPENRRGNAMFYNLGGGRFRDASVESGAYDALWSWGGAAFDADADGDVDLFVPNGYIIAPAASEDAIAPGNATRPLGELQPNRFFENLGNGTLAKRARAWGLDARIEGRGAAALDFDGNGAVDLVTTATAHAPLLLRNGAPPGAFLELRLQGVTCNRDAVGAQVRVLSGGRVQAAQREAGSGYVSQGWPILHFGLGAADRADVQVRWPDGPVQVFHGVAAGRYALAEGGALQPR